MYERLNPYGAPPGKDPWVKLMIHAGGMTFDADALDAIVEHLRLAGFIHLGDTETRHRITVNIGIPGREADIVIAPGEEVDYEVPDGWRSYCRIAGQAPPGLALDGDRLVGVCNIPGFWDFEVVVGPAIQYDALGSGGAPLEPGEWCPIDEPRTKPTRAAAGMDLTELTRDELDDVIAQAQAAKQDMEVTEQ